MALGARPRPRIQADNLSKDKVHTVSIEIHPEQPDRTEVLERVRDNPNFKPEKYDGTNVWAGYLMLIGDPVE